MAGHQHQGTGQPHGCDPVHQFEAVNIWQRQVQYEGVERKNFPAFEQMIKFNRSYLDSLVRKDRKEIRQFFQKRKNNISPAFNSMYDQYLKLNKQPAGIDSYDDVIAWLIAYKKKFGKI